MKLKLIAITLLLLTFGLVQAKERDWKTGKVLDTSSEKYTTYSGSTTYGRIDDEGNLHATTSTDSRKHRKFEFVIEGEGYTYIVSHDLKWRWSKEIQITVNGPVKYAVEKNDLYLIDENGKEFKLKIDKKILR